MNVVIIILGICVVVLVYILYAYFMSTTTQLISLVQLSTVTSFNDTQITNQTSANYAYGLWIYIDTWDDTNVNYILLANKPTNAALAASPTDQQNPTGLNLYLDNKSPTLYYDIGVKAASGYSTTFVSGTGFRSAASGNLISNGNTSGSQKITTNFPIQAWVQIIISVNGQIVDVYLNGQLVSSQSFEVIVPIQSASPVQIGIANGKLNGTVAQFIRWSNQSVDPQTAMSSYLSGNGQTSALSNYNMSFDLTKNNNKYVHYNVF